MGAFPLGLPEVSAAKFSRMGRSLDCAIDVGSGLLPATTTSGQRPSRSGTSVGIQWIRIVFRCWKDRVAYDESKYLAALAKRGSPLGKLVVVGVGTSL